MHTYNFLSSPQVTVCMDVSEACIYVYIHTYMHTTIYIHAYNFLSSPQVTVCMDVSGSAVISSVDVICA